MHWGFYAAAPGVAGEVMNHRSGVQVRRWGEGTQEVDTHSHKQRHTHTGDKEEPRGKGKQKG